MRCETGDAGAQHSALEFPVCPALAPLLPPRALLMLPCRNRWTGREDGVSLRKSLDQALMRIHGFIPVAATTDSPTRDSSRRMLSRGKLLWHRNKRRGRRMHALVPTKALHDMTPDATPTVFVE